MRTPWQLRDYVFAAFMTIGMVVAVFIVGPFAPPGFQLLAWSPFAGIFLTLGMARLQRRGSVLLMILPLAILLGVLSPIITLYLAATILVTELVMFFVGNYRRKINRLIGNVLFFGSANLFGLLLLIRFSQSLLSRVKDPQKADSFANLIQFISQPGILILLTVLAILAGALGWFLGELAVKQLQKAGKLDLEN
ncbi:MptD family putative ECF transporter S component [Kovacikia minuta CCNUW1]|uniref:MptD family putative ECF transporter S component n=1 Tax=Kovacikia minuta TaxID=2931930 RepID=UPI001CCB8DAF|nr:MptD family putative ECF transporter S component [Kovacikia minuta]UBF27928.1 MptD family putative ECF transporter S component [Kovacikia minuta CCNUW1]